MSFTADDFKTATIATRGTLGVARRLANHDSLPWLIDGEDWEDDEGMVEYGWKPVREAGDWGPMIDFQKANDALRRKLQERGSQVEHLEELLDDAVDANRTLRDRNETLHRQVAESSRLAQDAKAAPLMMDSLREAWEAAEVPTEDMPVSQGDVVIKWNRDIGGGMFRLWVWEGESFCPGGNTVRVLHRAPRRPEWQGLADAIADSTHHPEPAGLAKALYAAGVRVITEGDESNE